MRSLLKHNIPHTIFPAAPNISLAISQCDTVEAQEFYILVDHDPYIFRQYFRQRQADPGIFNQGFYRSSICG